MAMPYKLYWEHDGVYWKYFGNVTGKEIIDASTSVYGDQRFDTLKYKLVDFLDAGTIEMNDDEVALIAYQHRSNERSNPYLKNAIVTQLAGIEQANKFASFFSDSYWEVRVFQNLDEANSWIKRKPC